MNIDLNQIIIAVVLSVISSSASFIMGGIWYITRTLSKHKKALDAAFTKIRNLEGEIYEPDGSEGVDRSLDQDSYRALCREGDDRPRAQQIAIALSEARKKGLKVPKEK